MGTNTTQHIFFGEEMFSFYTPINGKKLYMGNSATFSIVRSGMVILKMTSGRELILIGVCLLRVIIFDLIHLLRICCIG